MQIHNLGQAELLFDLGDFRLLTDPWHTEPIFADSLWHFPPRNTGFDGREQGIDALYISHHHADHFDPGALRGFRRDIPIFIPALDEGWSLWPTYKGRHPLKRRLAELGFSQVRPLGAWEAVALGARGQLVMVPADSGIQDSSIVIQKDGFCVLNQNDNLLSSALFDRIRTDYPVDLAFLSYSGAGEFPGCFDLSLEEKRSRSVEKRSQSYQNCLEHVQRLGARWVVPIGNDMAWLAPDQFHLNECNRFPVDDFGCYLRKHLGSGQEYLPLRPGLRVVVESRRPSELLGEERPEDTRSLRALALAKRVEIESMRAREQVSVPEGNLADAFHEWLKSQGVFLDARRLGIDLRLLFQVEGKQRSQFLINLNEGSFACLEKDTEEWDFRIRIDAGLWGRIIAGEVAFADAWSRLCFYHPGPFTESIKMFWNWRFQTPACSSAQNS